MACKLTKSTGASRLILKERPGDQVQLRGLIGLWRCDDRVGRLRWRYLFLALEVHAPSAGSKFLTVLLDNPVPRDWTTIQESCNGSANTLKHYPFDPYGPTQTFIVEAQ